LAFRASVDVDNDRTFAGELRRVGLVEKAGDGAAVKALPADELRLAEAGGVEASGFALGPAIDLAGFDVQGVDVER